MDANKYIKAAVVVFILAVAAIIAYSFGYRNGSSTGYQKALTDIKIQQEQSAKKTAEDAAKAVNPFKAANPLKNVETNPFKNVKVNPFK